MKRSEESSPATGNPAHDDTGGPLCADVVSKSLWARGLKRGVDFVLSSLGLLIAVPVLAVSIALMKITSPGPAFFYQTRTGRGGREFRPMKLRTMVADWKHDPNEIVPLGHQGVTPVGRVLRRLKIDELPQVWNVVRGDMALIGPRPTIPEQTRAYDRFQRQRLCVRPGLTGLAQVNGNASVSWEERINYDVYYVKHHGLLMDIGILLKTVLVVLFGEERYGRHFAESPYGRRQRGGC